MNQLLAPPLSAKNGHTHKVLAICRVSDPREGKQDERSVDDQEAMLREWIDPRTTLPMDIDVIAGSGSGEWTDREEVRQVEQAIASGIYDLVITEDLGRFLRRMRAYELCELAEDHDTRLIALNDHVDTALEGWRMSAFFASLRHEMYNADTAKRIRRTQRNRFVSGGVFQCEVFGYIKPPGAKSDEDVYKDPAAQPIYDRWVEILEDGGAYSVVADWLNAQKVPTGPYCDNDEWDGRMVARVTHNPILKGVRVRNNRMAKRINATGRRKSVKAPPSDRLERVCPHLAFIEASRYDRLIADLKARNAHYRRLDENGVDCRLGISRKRSRYPGQCIFCGICGEMYVFGGHGQTDHLMCDGARSYKCWNGATVDSVLAVNKLCAVVIQEIEALEEYDSELLAALDEEAGRVNSALNRQIADIDGQLLRIESESANLLAFIRDGRPSYLVDADLARLEIEQSRLLSEKARAERHHVTQIKLPPIEELKERGRQKFKDAAADSFEFAAELRRLTPRIVVFPHQLIDGGDVVLRAKFRLQLSALIPDRATGHLLRPSMEKTLTVDLFDRPQREDYRVRVVSLREKKTERQAAKELGITVTATQNAMALHRRMLELGVVDAYHPVLQPPETGRLRRHLHPRYKFEPRPDAGQL